jgi:hypothetical protein
VAISQIAPDRAFLATALHTRGVPNTNLRFDRADTPEQILQKIIYHAGRANIREVWVANRRVHTQDMA